MRCVLALAVLVAGCAQAPKVADAPLGTPLSGTWRLVSIFAQRPNGDRLPSRFGTSPPGYIFYDGSGHMAVQIEGSPWPPFANPDKPTPAELEAVYNGYVAYAGTYDFDAAARTVTHHVQMSVDPGDVGKNFERAVELDGNHLTLSVQRYPLNGEQVTLRLTWEHVG